MKPKLNCVETGSEVNRRQWQNNGPHGGVRYDDFWSWMIKTSPRSAFEEISCYSAHCISYSFGASVSIVYNTTYSGRVTLTGQCTYSWSQKYIAYKPCRLNISFTRWSDFRFFWAHTPEARTLKPCQTAPDYWTKLSFKLIWSKHTKFTLMCVQVLKGQY